MRINVGRNPLTGHVVIHCELVEVAILGENVGLTRVLVMCNMVATFIDLEL